MFPEFWMVVELRGLPPSSLTTWLYDFGQTT
jgi:hypothetical protein